jgi:hypothetical protein
MGPIAANFINKTSRAPSEFRHCPPQRPSGLIGRQTGGFDTPGHESSSYQDTKIARQWLDRTPSGVQSGTSSAFA